MEYTKKDGTVTVSRVPHYTQYRCRLHHPDEAEVAAIFDEVRAGAKTRKEIAADHQLTYRRLNLLLKRHAPELVGCGRPAPPSAGPPPLTDEEVEAILEGVA